MFMAKGPKIRAGETLASGRLVDEGPTMLAMLDLSLIHIDAADETSTV